MPIVVIILGIIIVALGAVVVFVPKPDETPTEIAPVEEVNRTESMELEEESLVESEAETNPDTGIISDTPESVTAVTFTETGSYLTPARTSHELAVSLTLEDGIVTAADVVYDGGEGFSNPNQERFDGAFAAEVIGKPLSEISLSRVGGASLTTNAFNEAVAKIAAASS